MIQLSHLPQHPSPDSLLHLISQAILLELESVTRGHDVMVPPLAVVLPGGRDAVMVEEQLQYFPVSNHAALVPFEYPGVIHSLPLPIFLNVHYLKLLVHRCLQGSGGDFGQFRSNWQYGHGQCSGHNVTLYF